MNNIPGASYKIDQSVKNQLHKLPYLSGRFSLPNAERSNLEIVRLLSNRHYGHIQNLLEFLDRSALVAGPLVDEILKLTDPMEFGGRLSELYLLCHIANRMPDRAKTPNASRSEKKPDIEVSSDGLNVAVEVYSPMNLFGFQLVNTYAILILKNLDINLGYALKVKIEPQIGHDPFYAYQFETEKEIRPWLCQFAKATTDWLSAPSPQPVFQMEGPSASGWNLSIEIENLCTDSSLREIGQSTAGRSDDARLYFEVEKEKEIASGWWGQRVKKKMARRQAGSAPADGLFRLLVIDFARLDTSFPDFIRWSRIVERIDTSIRLLASEIGDPLSYDAVLPARLGQSCCFGVPVWLGKGDIEARQRFFDLARLTKPCEAPTVEEVDWTSILATS